MKRLLIFILLVFIITVFVDISYSSQDWARTYGGSDTDGALSIQQTTDRGYVVAGYSGSFGAGGNNDWDVWILKLDANGEMLWQKTYGGDGDDITASIQQTADGGYVTAGYTTSFGAGDFDAWVLKLDASGEIQWQKTYGGSSNDFARSIQQTADGGYIVAGFTYSFGAGEDDVWVLKLDASGEIQWQKTYGGSNGEEAYSIQQTADGGYVVAGGTTSFGAGGLDVWVLKLNAKGEIQWQKTYGGSVDDFAYSIQQTADGGYVMAGSFGVCCYDAIVLKLDTNGEIQWQKTYGGGSDDGVASIQQTEDGGYILTGATSYFFSINNDNSDVWVLKLDVNGIISNCNIMGTGTAVSSNTSVAGQNSTSDVRSTNAIIVNTEVEPFNTSATDYAICLSDTILCSISGYVKSKGTGLSDVTVTLEGAVTGTKVTNYNGYYEFLSLPKGIYKITPSKSGYKFFPRNKLVKINEVDITGLNFRGIYTK
jgi:predicted secreted protein